MSSTNDVNPAPVRVIDLFAGAGGLSQGLHDIGAVTLLGSDFWPAAAKSYRANHQDVPFLEIDAHDLSAELLISEAHGKPDAIVGGPPCQGFSSAGAKNGADLRNSLVGVFASLIAEIKPNSFVFENVEGFLTSAAGDYVVALLDPLIEAGYKIAIEKLNVANYGVPQLRKRTIAIGSLTSMPALPRATHRAFGSPGSTKTGHRLLPYTPTVQDAIDDLPAVAINAVDATLPNHWVRPPGELNALRYKALKWGQTMRDLPPELQHDSYIRRANRRVSDGTPTEKRGGAPAGLRRLKPDEPSRAITSAAAREFIHPFEDRPLTLRECARLQTFPDEYQFLGSNNDVATLIGNAIPVRFASALGRALASTLSMDQGLYSEPGRLVHFEPTVGEQMSPALAAVTDRILSRYQKSFAEELTLWS
ncbi:DNA cytosine methyltransferase [Mycolicibacterium duvalii]|uniref:Cytosine-specific methyltransferase n=1 Tax=Mycolicibacterium duvalii TaxID=39688 RepID=A0A7I7JU45_9MYCO|nr:DNA cytosine methyltransferase [Mycolicibacterium duvalii]MCV7368612.1 DNA cytosine methyltransferase [Mycolicibacterium duvalii]BBX15310.1 cytosine-specific methyltransferase [Mycolicibacterium duvalii]